MPASIARYAVQDLIEFEDGTQWVVEHVSPGGLTIRCVKGEPSSYVAADGEVRQRRNGKGVGKRLVVSVGMPSKRLGKYAGQAQHNSKDAFDSMPKPSRRK